MSMKVQAISILSIALIALSFSSCRREPDTVGEKIKDGLDARPNEKVKDTGEDIKDAADNAADAVKDAVR